MNLLLRAGVFLLAGCLLRAQAPSAQDWQKATDLPALDTSGLSTPRKATLLKILREEGCTCNCGMRVAECRVKDPACGDSRALASIAVQQLKAGKTEAQIRTALKDSELARARRANLFGEPVKLSLEGAPSRGPANARITIVEFSDFQCPYCRIAAKNAYTLLSMFPKDVRLVYKQFPLEDHSQAEIAAEGALAAHAQGKFWELHDRMFAAPREISRAKLGAWALELGLDLAKFNADLNSGKYKAQVRKDVQEGVSAGVQGTPTFFINGRQYRGAMDPAQLKPILEEELKKPLQARAR
ncbi:MAG: thioredoxin domain-containing protein [Bryobacterales bacterium]|nr:thioredoxin domain-containing protein [Bryobacterales bacterium]